MDKNKKKVIVMIIASDLFRDEELLVPKNFFEASAAKVYIASSSLNLVSGMLKAVVQPDMLIDDIQIEKIDALILVGGSGAVEYFNNQDLFQLVQHCHQQNKCIGAICIAPVILARAGLLKHKKATVYPTEAEHIQQYGAIYVNESLVITENIITANGPQAALPFAQAIGKFLQL